MVVVFSNSTYSINSQPMVRRACKVAITTERVVLSSCWLLLLLPSSNTLTQGSRFRQQRLCVCYMLLPFYLATPPGFHGTYIPNGNLSMYMYNMHFVFQASCSPAAEEFFSHFRPRDKQGGRGSITTYVLFPAEHRGGARCIERRWVGSKQKGIALRLAEPSRWHRKPPRFLYFLKARHPWTLPLLYICFQPQQKQPQQQTYSSSSTHLSAVACPYDTMSTFNNHEFYTLNFLCVANINIFGISRLSSFGFYQPQQQQ